jgi:hypothetical protein
MSKASDLKRKTSSVMNEDRINEDRLRIVIIDADDQSASQVSDILSKALSKDELTSLTAVPTEQTEPTKEAEVQ